MQQGWLLDHLVSAGEEGGRDSEAERLRGLEIDNQLQRGRLHDRQVSRLGTLEDPSGVNADLSIKRRDARPIADQTAFHDELTPLIDRRNGMACRQRNELLAPAVEEWIGGDDERAGLPSDEGGEGGV